MIYMGSKNRLSKQIVPIIQNYIDKGCNGYLEPFVGGANIIDKIECDNKIGSDIDKYVISVLIGLQQGIEPPKEVSKEFYIDVKNNPDKYSDFITGYIGYELSFGAKWFGGYAKRDDAKHRGDIYSYKSCMSCMDEATRCSASWLLSFNKTSTIPAINYIDRYYNADCKNNGIGIGAVSTEHSVMGANFSIDGDEITFVKRLLTELYPNTSFSMVSDTYDYWNMVNNILPQCKEEIMNHNGKLLVRPDSGDIVEISVKTVDRLWEIFGGSVNGKGYKVLNPHIGIIYGDGCTLSNVETIWKELEKRGFAANNIAYGVGAFCFTAIVENGKMIVVTRDTFGIAMKATYGVIDGKKLMIFKDPKTDTSHLKKSHKGCCRVYDDNGELKCQDQLLEMSDNSLLTTVFKDGELVREDTFADIRNRMYGGK